MHIWQVEALWLYGFCEKQIFPYNKGINFILTIMVVETTLRMATPSQSQLKVIINPTN